MESMDNFRERFEALEQRTEHLQQHTRTIERRLRWWRGIACGLLIVALASLPLPVGTAKEDDRERENEHLQRRVNALEAKLAAVTFDSSNHEIVITGVNLRIVNGLETTETTNGLGNLIVGYNELRQEDPNCPPGDFPGFPCTDTRTGSHNVVVGSEHNFSRFGGLVVGFRNEISGPFASVSGGSENIASGPMASVSGGEDNTASGPRASVSGGEDNVASNEETSVSGGVFNTASGPHSSVSGGEHNTASGSASSVSGGSNRSAPGTDNWATGPLFADN